MTFNLYFMYKYSVFALQRTLIPLNKSSSQHSSETQWLFVVRTIRQAQTGLHCGKKFIDFGLNSDDMWSNP